MDLRLLSARPTKLPSKASAPMRPSRRGWSRTEDFEIADLGFMGVLVSLGLANVAGRPVTPEELVGLVAVMRSLISADWHGVRRIRPDPTKAHASGDRDTDNVERYPISSRTFFKSLLTMGASFDST